MKLEKRQAAKLQVMMEQPFEWMNIYMNEELKKGLCNKRTNISI